MKKIYAALRGLFFVVMLLCFPDLSIAGDTAAENIKAVLDRIGANASLEEVGEGMAILEAVGVDDFDALANSVGNEDPASKHLQESKVLRDEVTGEVKGVYVTKVGDVILSVIQNKIEGRWPKFYYPYRIINKGNVKDWVGLVQRRGLQAVRIEVAVLAVRRAKEVLQNSPYVEAKDVIKVFEERLVRIKSGKSPDIE